MFDEPELHIIKFPDQPELRARRDHQRTEGWRRYRDRLAVALPLIDTIAGADDRANAILEHLFVATRAEDESPCVCSCHPALPASDFHDYGFRCACQLTAEERRAEFDEWQAGADAYRGSTEGKAETAARQAEEDELVAWLVGQPDVVVTMKGGWAPEQWRGAVAGHAFYFRERHDDWSIELDVRPTGEQYRRWVGGDLDDAASYEAAAIERGDVIAHGTVDDTGYGNSPVERAEFIVDIIRVHLLRQQCTVHRSGLANLVTRVGGPISWCPACGTRL